MSSSLAETLAALDSLPALEQSLRLKELPATWQEIAIHWITSARHSLESQAVIQEHRDDVPHRCPDELRWLRMMDAYTNNTGIDLTPSNQLLFNRNILLENDGLSESLTELLLQFDDVDPSVNDNAALSHCIYNNLIDKVILLLQSDKFHIDDSGVVSVFDKIINETQNTTIFKLILKHPRFVPTYPLLMRTLTAKWVNGFDILLRDGQVDPGDLLTEIIGHLDYLGKLSEFQRLLFEFGSRLLRDGRAKISRLTYEIIKKLPLDLLELLVKDPRMEEAQRIECLAIIFAKFETAFRCVRSIELAKKNEQVTC